MLVSMKAILEDANTNYYGVMAMNSINIEMARAGIMAAEEEHSPIIIQFGPGQMKIMPTWRKCFRWWRNWQKGCMYPLP